MGIDYNLIKEAAQMGELVQITWAISRLYDDLYSFEITKNNELFEECLDHLRKMLELEEEAYSDLNLTPSRKTMTYNFITSKQYRESLIKFIPEDHLDKVINRMAVTFQQELRNNQDIVTEPTSLTILRVLKKVGIEPNSKEAVAYIRKHNNIAKAFENELASNVIVITNNLIVETIDFRIIDNLLKTKYIQAFRYKEIELAMVSNGFSTDYFAPIDSEYIIKSFDISHEEYLTYKKNHGIRTVNKEIESLLKIPDQEYPKEETADKATESCCYLRAGLLMLDNDTIMNLKTEFKDFINSSEYKNSQIQNQISIDIINYALKKVKSDSKKVRTLTRSKKYYN